MKTFAAVCVGFVVADIPGDLVDQLPGFEKVPFNVYSGLLDVPGPINGFDSLKIHYQFHTSQGTPTKDPVVTWHQGGPGSSSIQYGLYTEMGYFHIDDQGYYANPHAWNKVANMLYLESPAGSGSSHGYSMCMKGGEPVDCYWDDVTQGEAYAHTLGAFFSAFPEFADNDLYLTGESYFGQYGPNIAHFIVNDAYFNRTLNLKGVALGNACWGGDETHVQCNGPNSKQNDVELFFGKGLFSPKTYKKIYAACDFLDTSSSECRSLLSQYRQEVGPHNVYNIYDNCPQMSSFLEKTGKDMEWLTDTLREGMSSPHETHAMLEDMSGGFDWSCGGADATAKWLLRSDVRQALHLDKFEPGLSRFHYRSSGPASVTLYPELVKKLRIFIYNGDADACVPYIGNEEWIGNLEQEGIFTESKAWTPWYTSTSPAAPAGYVTEYKVDGSDKDFMFATIRLAGHMVPTFQPEAGFDMFSRWLKGQPLDGVSSTVV